MWLILPKGAAMDCPKSFAHQLLLLTFTAPRPLKQIPDLPEWFDKADWPSALGEPPAKAHANLIEKGLIIKADPAAHLDYHLRKEQIQEFLKQEQLPVSGNKDELINRIIQSETHNLPSYDGDQELYVISAKGKKCCQEYANSGEPDYMFKRTAIFILTAVTAGIIGNRADDIFLDSIRFVLAAFKRASAGKAEIVKNITPREETARADSSRSKTFVYETVQLGSHGRVIKQRKETARYFAENLGWGKSLELVEIPGGEFWMGSSEADVQAALADAKRWNKDAKEEWYKRESPRHRVKVSPFMMGRYPVTQSQWYEVMGDLPEIDKNLRGDDRPMVNVSWEEAGKFCRELTRRTNHQYRLPTEAEWEYACRAGTNSPFAFGPTLSPEVANYWWSVPYGNGPSKEPLGRTVGVGSLGVANAFGLYDMHGNVWEWCSDWYGGTYYEECRKQGVVSDPQGPKAGSYRVIRGGSWSFLAVDCRSASHHLFAPGARFGILGFRLVRIGR